MASFSSLPVELRLAIWELALRRDNHPGVHFFSIYRQWDREAAPSCVKEKWEAFGYNPKYRPPCRISAPQRAETIAQAILEAFTDLRHGNNISTYLNDVTPLGSLWSVCREAREVVQRHLAKLGLSREFDASSSSGSNGPVTGLTLHPSVCTGRFRNERDGSMQHFIIGPDDLIVLQPIDLERIPFGNVGVLMEQRWAAWDAWHGVPTRKSHSYAQNAMYRAQHDLHFAFEMDPTWRPPPPPLTGFEEKPVPFAKMREAFTEGGNVHMWFIDYRMKRRPNSRSADAVRESLRHRHVFSANGYRFVEVKLGDPWVRGCDDDEYSAVEMVDDLEESLANAVEYQNWKDGFSDYGGALDPMIMDAANLGVLACEPND